MSPSPSVIHLHDYRGRRDRRLREGMALYRGDAERSSVAPLLREMMELTGGDRAASLWVDEYGVGAVHVHTLLDLLEAPPRRAFSLDVLQNAWERGIPGFLDQPDQEPTLLGGGPRSRWVVALGSDGSRGWFLVVDSMRPRKSLGRDCTSRLLFLAGECAAVLLHRDLEHHLPAHAPSDFEKRRRESFGGWPVLQDIEGRERDEEANRRIAARFLVARVIRSLIDEEFAVDRESLGYRIGGVRRELGTVPAGDPERRIWEEVLDAAAGEEWEALAAALLDLGNVVERSGHLFGAREFHRSAYEVALVTGSLDRGLAAARFHARACRKVGDFPEAERWYDAAMAMARAADDHLMVALVLDGLASTFREKGDLVSAKRVLREELNVARESRDPYALASCHHNWMSVEKASGEWAEAAVNGWKAFGTYPDDASRVLALLDLAGVFVQSGSYRSAEDAYTVVATRAEAMPVRAMALEGLAHLSAVKGLREEFQLRAEAADAAGWRALPATYRAQLELLRGRSWRLLGETAVARRWLERCVESCSGSPFSLYRPQAEDELRSAGVGGTGMASLAPPPRPLENLTDERVREVLEGVSELRARLAG